MFSLLFVTWSVIDVSTRFEVDELFLQEEKFNEHCMLYNVTSKKIDISTLNWKKCENGTCWYGIYECQNCGNCEHPRNNFLANNLSTVDIFLNITICIIQEETDDFEWIETSNGCRNETISLQNKKITTISGYVGGRPSIFDDFMIARLRSRQRLFEICFVYTPKLFGVSSCQYQWTQNNDTLVINHTTDTSCGDNKVTEGCTLSTREVKIEFSFIIFNPSFHERTIANLDFPQVSIGVSEIFCATLLFCILLFIRCRCQDFLRAN